MISKKDIRELCIQYMSCSDSILEMIVDGLYKDISDFKNGNYHRLIERVEKNNSALAFPNSDRYKVFKFYTRVSAKDPLKLLHQLSAKEKKPEKSKEVPRKSKTYEQLSFFE